jgi:hypothetical protein
VRSLSSFLFVPRVLDLATRGASFRRFVAVILYLAAGILGLSALLAWIGVWAFAKFLDSQGVLGLVVFQVLLATAAYAVVHTLIFRAHTILNLSDGKFAILPIASVLLRLAGECLFFVISSVAVGSGLLTILAGPMAGQIAQTVPFGSSLFTGVGFISGVMGAGFGLLVAFAVLLTFYLLAESGSLLTTIAVNSEVVREIVQAGNLSVPQSREGAQVVSGPSETTAAPASPRRCPRCSTIVGSLSRFCTSCGTTLSPES